MENAIYDQKATSKLLRHFYIVVLKSSTQIYRGIYSTSNFVNYLQSERCLSVRVH